MTAERLSVVFAAIALVLAAPTAGRAQSFDCAKAATPTERLICAEQKLGKLDTELAEEVKKALAAVPNRRDDLLGEQRKWLKERDRNCAAPAGALTSETRVWVIDCLAAAYRERISAIRSAAGPAQSAEAQAAQPTAICQRIGETYRAVLDGDSQAPSKKFYAESPLESIVGFGVTLAEPVAQLDSYSRRKVVDWAMSQQQPFMLSESVLKAFDDIASTGLRIDRLPGTDFYAASVVVGTAACYSTRYFEMVQGRARLAEGPPAWETGGGEGCGVTRVFGTIDKMSVAFEDAHDHTPSLASSLGVSPWSGKGFEAACTVTFQFAPRFDAHGGFNAWEERCDGADCEALRQASLALVEEVQKNPLEARKTALARLTAPQRGQFAQLRKQAGTEEPPQADGSIDPSDPAAYTDAAPLLLPLVHEGRVYLAGVGHFTVGWRVFSDWSVALKRLDNGKARDHAVFAIGMTKGRFESFSVK